MQHIFTLLHSTSWIYAASPPLSRALANQPWNLARFSGSEKSLNPETLSSPSSSTRVRMMTESNSSLMSSTV